MVIGRAGHLVAYSVTRKRVTFFEAGLETLVAASRYRSSGGCKPPER